MDNWPAQNPEVYRQRRRERRRQQRLAFLRELWRTLAVLGLLGGLAWTVRQPLWAIRQPDQVVVRGNLALPAENVRAKLPITYPQLVWAINPQTLADAVAQEPLVNQVKVSRRFFPPRIEVWVEERQPVAVLLCITCSPARRLQGLLDAEGHQLSAAYGPRLRQLGRFPGLEVVGWRPALVQEWPKLYALLAASPVRITRLDWQNPGNLILTTELGQVYLGSDASRLRTQLTALDQMRQLPQKLPRQRLVYIDLRNPDDPLVQLKPPPPKPAGPAAR